MPNYPPPPTFGIPFNPTGHMEPPVGSYGLPQHPYPYQHPSYGQGQADGMPIVPPPHTNANTHSFRSNAQGVTTPSYGNELNGTPYALHGGQIQYSAFQSSAFPPMPFAYGAPPYEAQPFGQSLANSKIPSNSSTVFSNLPDTAEVQSTNIGGLDIVPPAMSELEDGELDDGENEKLAGRSRASTTTSLGISQHKRHENEDSADRDSDHRTTSAPNKPLPGLIQGIQLQLNAVGMSDFRF